MVTVGAGKERFSGLSVLERLHQGSRARAQVIKAAREAELARRSKPIADLTSGEITRKKLGITAVGTAGLVTLVAAIACEGGQGQEVKTTPTQPANSPVATETAPTPTPIPTAEPTPSPEATPTPEGWSDEEIAEAAAKISSAVHIANTVVDIFPESKFPTESKFLSTVKDDLQTAEANYNHVIETKDYSSIGKVLDGFVNVGDTIGQFACDNTYGEVEGNAWAEIRSLVLYLSLKYENSGYIEKGKTETYKQALTLPGGCTNPIMLSSQ